MSETHDSWKSRCFAIMAALGIDFGENGDDDVPDISKISYSETIEEYWKNVIGGTSYYPKVYGRHEAGHPVTVKKVFDNSSDECKDVLAAFIWRLNIVENRAQFFIEEYQKLRKLEKTDDDEGL